VKAGKVSVFVATAAEEGIRERLSAAETREKELTLPNPLRALFAPLREGDTRAADTLRKLIEINWDDAPRTTQREALRALLSPDMIGQLRVQRSPTPRQRCPIERRVSWCDADASAAA